jgi:predicted RecB family nuclease
MENLITASMLYNLVQCPHRLYLDLYEDPDKRDPESIFLQLLWERGTFYEQKVVMDLTLEYTDLGGRPTEERENLTREAMEQGVELIYGGRIRTGNLLGDPDLLKRQGSGYIAGDIKSGVGEEAASGESEGRPKRHYAVQLAFYTDILERLGVSAGRFPFIWDVHGEEVLYDLGTPLGKRNAISLWNFYEACFAQATRILKREDETTPALVSACKLCHWRSLCITRLVEHDDLSLIPMLGRSKRDALLPYVKTVHALAHMNIEELIIGDKSVIQGISAESLGKFHLRARLQKSRDGKPVVTQIPRLPMVDRELFFDIETDPMRDVCYLHGFVERKDMDSRSERYVAFFADSPTEGDEKQAFREAWEYVRAFGPCVIYFYSKYERTWWYRLQERYPEIATREQIVEMFDPSRAIDLYTDVVRACTEWPTRDYSIKTLARCLGFRWRDTNPSGAESIEWYYRWVENGDCSIKERILQYNEDDCRATRVLLDGIRAMVDALS